MIKSFFGCLAIFLCAPALGMQKPIVNRIDKFRKLELLVLLIEQQQEFVEKFAQIDQKMVQQDNRIQKVKQEIECLQMISHDSSACANKAE